MKYTEGGRAWQFLMRNPDYIVDWWIWAAGTPPPQGDPFPIRRQTREEEAAAAKWGILAWEDPLAGDGALSPFWQAAPTLEAVPVPGNPIFAELLETPGARLSGVRMSDGATVLKAEEGNASVQLRIADRDSFDFTCGVALVTPRVSTCGSGCAGRPICGHRGFERKEPRQRVPDWQLLLALDMSQAGDSAREIGNAIREREIEEAIRERKVNKAVRKKVSIPKDEWSDSALRAMARRRVEKAEWLMTEGYLKLAAGR